MPERIVHTELVDSPAESGCGFAGLVGSLPREDEVLLGGGWRALGAGLLSIIIIPFLPLNVGFVPHRRCDWVLGHRKAT